MHRFVAFLLLALYLPVALNAMVTAHYCMGKLTGVDVVTGTASGNTCTRCSMIKKDQKGCCHDRQAILKVNKDQLSTPSTTIAIPLIAILYSSYFSLPDTGYALRANDSPTAHSPPLTGVSSLLLHCVFRI